MSSTNLPLASLALAVLVPALSGCGHAAVALHEGDGAGGVGEALLDVLRPGRRVVLLGADACGAPVGDSLAALAEAKGKLADAPWSKAPSFWVVGEASMQLAYKAEDSFLAVKLVDGPAPAEWLRLPTGQPLRCLVPASDGVVAASKLAGRTLAFTPGRASCTQLATRGTGASSLVIDAEPAAKTTFGAMTLDATGQAWVDAGSSHTRVRADVVRDCFDEPSAATKRDAVDLVRTPIERCTRSDDGGSTHVECRSTIGVWEGVATDAEVSLRLVRRTIGPVHFTGGKPVDGQRYARTVVSVTMGRPSDARTRAIGEAIQRSTAAALAGGDGGIRVAAATDPAVGHKLEIDTSAVEIGELVRRQVPASSQYQDGTRTVPNPELPKAQEAAARAKAAAEKAHVDHDRAVEEHKRELELAAAAKETCLQGCGMNTNPNMANLCRTTCEAGKVVSDALMHGPSDADVAKAEREVVSTTDALANTPPTITEPVMKTWSYNKTLFSRNASTTLRVVVRPRHGDATRFDIPLQQSWEDFEVIADGAHNVPAHEPAREPIDRPDALVPWLAERASQALAKRLRTVLDQAELAEAKRALGSGDRAPKPGFEDVDAKALDVAGARLVEPVQRGRSTLVADTDTPLPSDGVALDAASCVLAVAVADGDEPATLTLASPDGQFADRRGKRFATVEACGVDARAAGDKVQLALRSPGAAAVHWGIYRTRATTPTDAATK